MSKRDAMAIVREDFDNYDKWGSALGHRFGIATVLWVMGEYVPYGWEFSPGMAAIGPDDIREDETYPDIYWLDELESGTISADDMRHAGNVLARYAELLRRADLDY